MKWMRIFAILFSFSWIFLGSTFARAEDEFEPISETEKIESQKATTAAESTQLKQEEVRSQHIESTSHETIWINLILIVLGVVAFFLRKFHLRYVLLLISVAILGFYLGGCPCPVGAATKIFVDWWTSQCLFLTATLLAMVLIPTAIFGRFFCGSACPIGALQEFLAVRHKLLHVPFKIERALRYGQYLFFAFLLIVSYLKGRYFFETIDPFRTIFNVKGNALQFSIAGILLLSSLFIYRPFCRYLCPLAVLMNLVGFISFFKIRKPTSCSNCNLCAKRCPMVVIDESNNVHDRHCIRCGDCMDLCKFKLSRFAFFLKKESKNEKI